MTRVQKERFFNEEDYVRMKDFYILDAAKMSLAKEDMLVLHPLPRVNEISVEVDKDPRAAYFKQVQYGVYVRMALYPHTFRNRSLDGRKEFIMENNTLNVSSISEGFVLDHIQAGKSMDIYHYLRLDKLDCCVAIHQKCRSNKMGKKDIMKIECPIDIIDLDILGFIHQQYHDQYHPE